jgi:MYXO-CTERM domain-containing protein
LLALARLGEPVDLGEPMVASPPARPEVRFHDLDAFVRPPRADAGPRRGTIAEPMDELTTRRRLDAEEDLPGNEYPRKHTLFMNFSGADLKTGEDNSAEDRSQLAQMGNYPVFTGGEPKALAAIQALASDLAPFGVTIVYEQRPDKLLPYTMAMIGGEWMDTQLDNPAAGVAATADCGALNQRRIVYVFADGGWSALEIASTAAQEAGHAWGLDHSYNCDSVMSYCLGADDKIFSNTCDDLCELDCQLPANCRVTHEMFCGADSDQQNEVEELTWLFGGAEPDMEPPTVEIVSPEDGAVIPEGEAVPIVANISDDFGGYAWKYVVTRDGEPWYDQVAYDRGVDEQGVPMLEFVNLEPAEYVFEVVATDHAHDPVSDSITITVQGAGADTSGGADTAGTGDAEGSTGGDDEDDDDGSSGGGDDGAQSDDGGDEGCACSASGPADAWGTAGAFFGLFGVRARLRRRRSRCGVHARPPQRGA